MFPIGLKWKLVKGKFNSAEVFVDDQMKVGGGGGDDDHSISVFSCISISLIL